VDSNVFFSNKHNLDNYIEKIDPIQSYKADIELKEYIICLTLWMGGMGQSSTP